jgi:hypothetical protein
MVSAFDVAIPETEGRDKGRRKKMCMSWQKGNTGKVHSRRGCTPQGFRTRRGTNDEDVESGPDLRQRFPKTNISNLWTAEIVGNKNQDERRLLGLCADLYLKAAGSGVALRLRGHDELRAIDHSKSRLTNVVL